MTRIAFLVACLSIVSLGAGTRAAADPVTITSGSIVLSEPSFFQAGPIAIAGTRGFSIEGFVDTSEGAFDALRHCFPCEPRTDFSVGAMMGTFAIQGTATLDGQTYRPINDAGTSNSVLLNFVGTTVLPPANGSSSLVIRAPFTVTSDSRFQYEVTPGSATEAPELATVALRGRGTATVSFHASPVFPLWEFSQLRYDFAPTPEGSTLLMVGGGLAAILLRARARRTRSAHSL